MEKILTIILLAILLLIAIQDFKYRAIHIVVVIGVFLASMAVLWTEKGNLINFETIIYTLVVFSLLWLYLSIKNKGFINPFIKYIGLGDFLFLLAITPLFSLFSFIVFFVTGICLAAVLSILLKKYIQKNTIPLAGILAVYLVIIRINHLFFDNDIFHLPFFRKLI